MIATAVVGELAKCLPGARITCADVWLLQPPAGARVNSKVWAFVAMVALHAMAHGRRVMWARWQEDNPPANQPLITVFFLRCRTVASKIMVWMVPRAMQLMQPEMLLCGSGACYRMLLV